MTAAGDGAARGAGQDQMEYSSLPRWKSHPATIPGVIPLSELERRAIMNALEYTKGDRAIAAHLLGIGRTTLYRKLKEYNLVSD